MEREVHRFAWWHDDPVNRLYFFRIWRRLAGKLDDETMNGILKSDMDGLTEQMWAIERSLA